MAETARNEALDDATLAGLRARLEEERSRLRETLGDLLDEESGGGTHDALATEPEDVGEQAQDLTAEATDQALAENSRRLLDQVEHALARMDAGTYGLSEVSGKPIPLGRLQALPWATTNVDDSTTSP